MIDGSILRWWHAVHKSADLCLYSPPLMSRLFFSILLCVVLSSLCFTASLSPRLDHSNRNQCIWKHFIIIYTFASLHTHTRNSKGCHSCWWVRVKNRRQINWICRLIACNLNADFGIFPESGRGWKGERERNTVWSSHQNWISNNSIHIYILISFLFTHLKKKNATNVTERWTTNGNIHLTKWFSECYEKDLSLINVINLNLRSTNT